MPVYKVEKTNTWRVVYRYTDWTGARHQTQKRGFRTRREAVAWERERLCLHDGSLHMTFASFVERYTADISCRLRETTRLTKEHIIRCKLLPYFGKLKMCEITPRHITAWQNQMLQGRGKTGRPYSPVYLRTIHDQLTAIFNHAVRFYGLRENPCKAAGSMGRSKGKEQLFWTKDEYLCFSRVLVDRPRFFCAFEMLYWCGLRQGELLALTPADLDLARGTVSVTKSCQRLHRRDVITPPKTEKSRRIVQLPQFLVSELREYLRRQRPLSTAPLFPMTRSALRRELARSARAAGLPRIRIHDLRHSAVSLLLQLGFSPAAVADRVGHESVRVTYGYTHPFPAVQREMATRLHTEKIA